MSLQQFLSLSRTNQFSFTCPVFNVETKMAACTKLRDIVWAGGKPPVRRGCQAAMRCSMCPAAAMVSLYNYNGNFQNDHHGSLQPKQGKLMTVLLERCAKVIPIESVVNSHGLSDAEKALLYSTRERFEQQLKTSPGQPSNPTSSFESTTTRKRSAPKPAPTAVNQNIAEAAATGNLAAAINAA